MPRRGNFTDARHNADAMASCLTAQTGTLFSIGEANTMSPLSTLIAIFIEPGKAMQAVREKSMLWLPLLLLVLGTAAVQVWYYQVVDIGWLQDHILSASGANADPQAMEAAKSFMSRNILMGGAVVGTLLALPIILLITAVYYLLAAKVIGNDITFGKWFAFSTWCTVPTLLLIPVGIAKILTSSNGQLPPEALNPLSLNQLLLHLPASDAWAGLANAISLPSLWSVVVAIIGYKVWTSKSTLTSAIVVLLPLVLIYGGMAAFALLRSAV